ncbi:TPA: hypothetical protein DEP21_03975 [Patescibacteria group bacterium]|nr:hypothetical protein [Candidatus Gracilibacteria bacterium]
MPHFLYTQKPSTIEIELKITNNDKENMFFIQKQKELFNSIIKTYSTIDYTIPSCQTTQIQEIEKIHIRFSIDTTIQTATLIQSKKSESEQFVLDYLIHQELFQLCIILYNEKIRKADQRGFYPLKNTF